MKHFLLLFTACLTLCSSAISQSPSSVASSNAGKHKYDIYVTSAGDPLGDILIELYPDIAPNAVRNFDSLLSIVPEDLYYHTKFHKVVPGFKIQGGDPNSKSGARSTWGLGRPDQRKIPAEISRLSHLRGMVAMWHPDNDTNGATSQFFILTADHPELDGKYTIIGKVTGGMDIVDSISHSPADGNNIPVDDIVMSVTATGTDKTKPAAAALVSPADNTRKVPTSQKLVWNSVAGALLYEVQVSEQPDFSTFVVDDLFPGSGQATSSYTVNNLGSGGRKFYWRVRATNGGLRGDFPDAWSFSTPMLLPTLLSPDDAATSVTAPVTLTWNTTVSAASYHVQVSDQQDFITSTFDRTGITDTSVDVSGLQPITRYYWRVVATDGVSDSTTSPIRSFTTAVVNSVSQPDNSSIVPEFSIVPKGAAASDFEARFVLSAAANTNLSIADESGREIATLLDQRIEAGAHVVGVPAGLLRSGVYFFKLNAGGTVKMQKFSVVR